MSHWMMRKWQWHSSAACRTSLTALYRSALDALVENDEMFTFTFVVSRAQQEEQRHIIREQDAL